MRIQLFLNYNYISDMKINRVTITGADNKVDKKDLLDLQNEFPFVEWGILFSVKNEPRYPDKEWIHSLGYDGALNLSAHFCGWYSRAVLQNNNTEILDACKAQFNRFQLNYNFSYPNQKQHAFAPIIDWCENNPTKAIILQYNKSNASELKRDFPSNVHFLFDSSGGRGKEIDNINPPFNNRYTGYSGGINGRNIVSVCKQISEVEFNDKVWIDMENGVRTNNQFDKEKVRDVLTKSQKFVV